MVEADLLLGVVLVVLPTNHLSFVFVTPPPNLIYPQHTILIVSVYVLRVFLLFLFLLAGEINRHDAGQQGRDTRPLIAESLLSQTVSNTATTFIRPTD